MTSASLAPAPPRPAIPEDSRLPQLAVALDCRRMSPLLPVPESACQPPRWEIRYIRYKPGTNCIVLYESPQRDGPPVWVYAKLYADERPSRASDGDLLTFSYPELRITVSAFPRDLQIPALRIVLSPGESYRILRRLVVRAERGRFLPSWEEWEPLRYKPERRCVMRGRHEGPGADSREIDHYARFYSDHAGARTAEWHRCFDGLGGAGIATPRLIGYSEKFRVLLVEGLAGRPLRFPQLPDAEVGETLEQSAQALAAWRRLPPPPSAPRFAVGPAELFAAAEPPAALVLDQAAECHELTAQMSATIPAEPEERLLLHGDFYYDQVLLPSNGSGRPGVIDLDKVSVGDPVADVATFCAHLWRLAVAGEISADSALRWSARFTTTYEAAAGRRLEDHRLRWLLGVALLKLAPEPFRRFAPDWPRQVRALVNMARRAVEGALC